LHNYYPIQSTANCQSCIKTACSHTTLLIYIRNPLITRSLHQQICSNSDHRILQSQLSFTTVSIRFDLRTHTSTVHWWNCKTQDPSVFARPS